MILFAESCTSNSINFRTFRALVKLIEAIYSKMTMWYAVRTAKMQSNGNKLSCCSVGHSENIVNKPWSSFWFCMKWCFKLKIKNFYWTHWNAFFWILSQLRCFGKLTAEVQNHKLDPHLLIKSPHFRMP